MSGDGGDFMLPDAVYWPAVDIHHGVHINDEGSHDIVVLSFGVPDSNEIVPIAQYAMSVQMAHETGHRLIAMALHALDCHGQCDEPDEGDA